MAAAAVLFSCRRARWHGDHELIILGIDGMDPELLRQYMDAGTMPNFSKLAASGTFRTLGTSIPPQSPVAWSNLITGMNPGGHGLFDFIHRDPKTMQPYFSASRVEPARHSIHIGSWVIPLGSGKAEQLRHGKAFWEYLDERGVPVTVFRIPSNFPPVPSHGRTLAGMGTPDLRGTYGTFSYYTDDPMVQTGEVEGGQIFPVAVENWRVNAALLGPDNSFRRGSPASMVPFTVSLDPVEAVAKFDVAGQEFVLREGEWSDWIRLDFTLLPVVANVKGICRMYLKQAHPRFELYVSPINIDPAEPALPLSTPSNYSRELSEEVGPFYTQGIAEDTKALSDGVLDDKQYLEQSREVMAEQRRIFDAEFPKFRAGVFFFYFSGIDLNSHMLWRQIDSKHPGYDAQAAAQYASALPAFYQQMDQVLAEILARMDEHTTLLVLSDHGFAPYYRSFNLNTWLLDNGYLKMKDGADQEQGEYFANVDWSKTRAYGLGLNGLYLNLKGRERDGIVDAGDQDKLLTEIAGRLQQVRDPSNNAVVITRVDRASAAYQGPYARSGPDLIVGYNRQYRAGWKTILGAFPRAEIEDNMNPWSGDHCMDYTLVPGILLSNRVVPPGNANLTDIAPTILAEFGITKGDSMIGNPLFSRQRTSEGGQ